MKTPEGNSPFAPMEHGSSLGYEAHYELSETMQVTQYHCHDYYELYFHLRGGELMGLDDTLYQLKPNQVFIIPPFHMHGLTCTAALHNYERAYLNLSPEVVDRLGCGQLDLNHFLRSHVGRGRCTYQLSADNADQFVRVIREIQQSSPADQSPVRRFRDYSLMMSLLTLLTQIIDREDPEEGGIVSNGIIQEVLSYINMHYTDPLTIHDLALRFNISPSYLSHEFTRFTNRGVYDYILYRRVMLSRQMMMSNDSLNTIAYQCGFNDYSNFLRSFTRISGQSPSQYRKQLRRYSTPDS